LQDHGVQVIRVATAESPRHLHFLQAWRELRRRGLRRVLVEGGGGLTADLLGWNCLDQVVAFVAPKLIGGQFAPSPVAGSGRPFMAEAWRLEELRWEASGEDLQLVAFVA
jgi:diaminohydroxyphosphoribosylaminopyrimidine deaminase/5-amino-6-(5-phosphoribosylamino)uracil reductase